MRYGLGLSPFGRNKQTPQRELNLRTSTPLSGIVGNFTGAIFAEDAPLSTSGSNAGNHTWSQSAKNNNQQLAMIKKIYVQVHLTPNFFLLKQINLLFKLI